MLKFCLLIASLIPTISMAGTWKTGFVTDHEVKYYNVEHAKGQILLLHGCKEQAEDIIQITQIQNYADAHALNVIVPSQNPLLNSDHCWNFFLPMNQVPGIFGSELEFLHLLITSTDMKDKPTYAFGISAGAAMVLNLYFNYGSLLRGIIVESGLAYLCVSDPMRAEQVLLTGPVLSAKELASRSYTEYMMTNLSHAPANQTILFVHGLADVRVMPLNAKASVDEMLGFLDLVDDHKANQSEILNHAKMDFTPADLYAYSAETWSFKNNIMMSEVLVDHMMHAWSGGKTGYLNSEPKGPDILDLFSKLDQSH